MDSSVSYQYHGGNDKKTVKGNAVVFRTRREFLKTTTIASAAFGSAALLRAHALYAGAGSEGRRELLAALSYEIIPHDRVSPSLYRRAADRIIDQSADSSSVAELVDKGLERLHELIAPTDWAALGRERRVAILKELDGGAFFDLLRHTTVEVLYRDPQVWKLIGYGGSAIEQGGYLDSFNNIDWLPDEG